MPTRSSVAVVGCGHRFRSAIEPALTSMGVHAVLIIDPDSGARSRTSDSLGRGTAVCAAELTAELLLETSPQAVIIASPSGLHYEHAVLALRCGLPTFVEKPAASNAIAVQELRARGCGLLVAAEQRRYRRDIQLVRSFIEMGELGEVERIVYRDFVTPAPGFRSTWRNDPSMAGGGVLLDLGYHTVGAIQWLLKATSSDFAITSARLYTAGLRVETRAAVKGTWGAAEIELEVGLDQTHPREEFTVVGSRGVVRVRRDRATGSSSVVDVNRPGAERSRLRVTLDSQHDTKSLRDFIVALPDLSGLTYHAATSRFIDQVYMSAEPFAH